MSGLSLARSFHDKWNGSPALSNDAFASATTWTAPSESIGTQVLPSSQLVRDGPTPEGTHRTMDLVDGITNRRHKMTEAEREHLSADDAKAEFDHVVVDIDVLKTRGLVVVPA